MFSLDAAIASAPPDVVLVAHSLACLLVAHWVQEETMLRTVSQSRESVVPVIGGALLVAVPDPDRPSFPPEASSFAPVPMVRFPFPSIIVASQDDPYGSLKHSARCARAWGSRLIDIGAAGHVNADSGLGDWLRGLDILTELVPDLPPTRRTS